jgi:hypothetical protein
MKKFFLILAVTLGLALGFSSGTTFSNEKPQGTETSVTNYVYVLVYENGAIWVYIYTEDGIYVGKVIDQQL